MTYAVPQYIAEEWVYFTESAADASPSDYDTPEEYQSAIDEHAVANAVLASGVCPDDMLLTLWQWLQSCEGMDWYDDDKKYARFERELGIHIGVYREWRDSDAGTVYRRGRSMPRRPDFRLKGKAYIFDSSKVNQ